MGKFLLLACLLFVLTHSDFFLATKVVFIFGGYILPRPDVYLLLPRRPCEYAEKEPLWQVFMTCLPAKSNTNKKRLNTMSASLTTCLPAGWLGDGRSLGNDIVLHKNTPLIQNSIPSLVLVLGAYHLIPLRGAEKNLRTLGFYHFTKNLRDT